MVTTNILRSLMGDFFWDTLYKIQMATPLCSIGGVPRGDFLSDQQTIETLQTNFLGTLYLLGLTTLKLKGVLLVGRWGYQPF